MILSDIKLNTDYRQECYEKCLTTDTVHMDINYLEQIPWCTRMMFQNIRMNAGVNNQSYASYGIEISALLIGP